MLNTITSKTETTKSDTSNSYTNAENSNTNNKNYSKQEYTYEPIEGTPFHLVQTPEQGYFIVMGMHRITQALRNREATLLLLETNKWEIIANVIAVMTPIINAESNTQELLINKK